MTSSEAFKIVVELARNNTCNQEEMPEEHARQFKALHMVAAVLLTADIWTEAEAIEVLIR